LFSSSKKFLEAIAFLASHGPLRIVLNGQGFDVLYTDITKLVQSFDMVDVHWSFAIGIHPQQATNILKDEKFISSNPNIWWLTFDSTDLTIVLPMAELNGKSVAIYRAAMDALGQNKQLRRKARRTKRVARPKYISLVPELPA
jgi:hypothetical protein